MAKLDKLITFAYLKDECDLPQNLPDDEFDKKINKAQQMLRMLMCDEFYKDFMTHYRANTLSSAYTALYDPYIKQFVAWQTNEYWTVKTNFKPTRSGFRVHTEENSTIASDTSMAMLIKDAKQDAQLYKKLLVDFLEGNRTTYTLYCGDCRGNLSGNSFHISAVKNKHKEDCGCSRCRC